MFYGGFRAVVGFSILTFYSDPNTKVSVDEEEK
jgi:hypothetical protein